MLYDPSHFVLQQLDYLGFIDLYHARIKAFHVKDAEFNPSARQGVYGGFKSWVDRAGRFRSLGRRPGGFPRDLFQARAIRLRRLGGAGMGMLHQDRPRMARREGAPFIRDHIIRGDRQGVRRFRRAGTDERPTGACWGCPTARASAPGHGRRRPRRLHRRRAPHRRTAGRRIRCVARRAVRRPRTGARRRCDLSLPIARTPIPRRWPRSEAARRTASKWSPSSRPTTCIRRGLRLPRAGFHVICDKPLTASWPRRTNWSARRARKSIFAVPTITPATQWCGRRARW